MGRSAGALLFAIVLLITYPEDGRDQNPIGGLGVALVLIAAGGERVRVAEDLRGVAPVSWKKTPSRRG